MRKNVLYFIIFLLVFLETSYAVTPYDLVIVREDNKIDYLIISPYLSTGKIPILFTSPDNLNEDQLNQTVSYYEKNSKVLIIGGRDAISENIENQIKNIGYSVTRLWDFNRYGTASRVAIDLWLESDSAVIVDGEDSKNYLNAQKLAFEKSYPILFSNKGQLPDSTKLALESMGTRNLYTFDDLQTNDYNVVKLNTNNVVFVKQEQTKSYIPHTLGLTSIILLSIIAYLWYKKHKIPSSFLTQEEKIVISYIKDGAKQNELPKLTGFSKPKISRILQLMESRNIIERKKEKKTYILKLKINTV